MTDSPDEYGELLRRALNAEANSVVPSPDGLEIIRTRIERRGIRGLMWWRAGVSVAGAVLVASTVVMVVPELRERVIPSVDAGQVNFTESTPPDGSATSRPPAPSTPAASNPAPLPIVSRSATPPAPEPTSSRSATASPRPSARPTSTTAKPRPTPTPPCPTPLDGEPIEGGEGAEPPEWCEDASATATPTPTQSPCSAEDCSPGNEVSPPTPTEPATPVPTPTGT
ncbi:hypothetical protein [Streptosporangium longisporum]|uniref:Uncharacterized protein n=1 Tax=Streptosporangium longisporum TaxID=46187 RepID=A0ABP6L9F1_9ACTN